MRHMRNKMNLVVFVVMMAFTVSCGGGGSGPADIGPADDDAVAAENAAAGDTLAGGDVVGARAAYDSIIGEAGEGEAASAGQAEARFGRALCDIFLLIEKDPTAAMLAGFGQPRWEVSSVFGAAGYFAQTLAGPETARSLLPFDNIRACMETRGALRFQATHRYGCLFSRVLAGYTSGNLVSSFGDLSGEVDSIIEDLKVAITYPGASYTIPKGLYSGDADISVNHSDMVVLLSAIYIFKAAADFANSWTFDFDLFTIADANGTSLLSRQQFVDFLNSSGQFSLRSDNRLSSARENLDAWADYAKQGLDEILAGASSGILNISSTNTPIYEELYSMVTSAGDAMVGNATIVDISPQITANMDRFFGDPPDGSSIPSDPFVLQGRRIKAVEAYWQQMISSVCDFTIGTRGVKVFSDAVRAIRRPYSELFSTIVGRHFGRHVAGGAGESGSNIASSTSSGVSE